MNFSDALASSIHDIKNSLSTVLIAVDELVNEPGCELRNPHLMNLLRQEAQRANNNLVQLLSIYKLNGDRLDARMDACNLGEFLEEIVAENSSLVNAMNISLASECDPTATGYFDENLIRGVLNHAVGNAERYSDSRIEISAGIEEGYTVFRVEDDGEGFPDSMLTSPRAEDQRNAFSEGHTQLGLYFASSVAELHKNGDRIGFIQVKNQHRLRGGCFELWLP
jgi:signal transduction histidine kinase